MTGHLAAPLAAAGRLALAYGLPADHLQVLKDGSNLLVRLAPAPVILRVATFTGRVRGNPLPYLAREVELVAWLAAAGAAVMRPSDLLPAGPHVVDGWAMAAWQFVEHEPGAIPSPGDTLAALDELHETLRSYPGELPVLGPMTSDLDLAVRFAIAEGILSAGEADAILRRRTERLEQLAALNLPQQAQHGDAFPRNTLVTARGIVWIDLEDACRGPRLWDLATLIRSTGDDHVRKAVVARYGEEPVRVALDLRQAEVEVWQALHDARIERGW